MNTKRMFVRVLTLVMLLGVLLSAAACGNNDTPPVAAGTTEGAVTNEDGVQLPFGKEDYGEDLTILYFTNSMYRDFYFGDVTEAGDVMQSALEERRYLVEEYLGVNVVGKAESDREDSIVTVLQRDNLAGLDNYQVALTHSYIGLGNLLSKEYVMDFYELEDISFNEEYWNLDAIDALEVGGKAYFATSDFNIADVQAVFYNKSMYEQYGIEENPYDLVRDGKWTLEKFMELSAKVDVNNGELAGTKNGIYGLGVRADWEFIPLVTSCEVEWLEGSGYRTLNMGSGNQKYQDLYDWVYDLEEAEWSYMYNFGDNENKVTIADGRFLFTMEPVKYSYKYLASEVKFGMLPYPKFDTNQTEYHSLDAGGVMCVPVMVQNKEMVGKVLECLSFYSADTVNIAYYERLLGTRVANAPDDAEMLDEYIFGTVTLNPVFNFSEKANEPLGILVYTIPKMLRAKLNGTTIATIATNWASYRTAAQEVVDATINR